MQIGNGAKEFDHSFPSLCLKWFKTSRKVRKEHDWQVFYQEMLVVILPEMDPLQVLVPKDSLHQQLQLFLNSLVCIEWGANTCFVEYLTNDILVLISGKLSIEENIKTIDSPLVLQTFPVTKNERVKLSTETGCIVLKGEKKHLQKIKSDILKQDRQIKEKMFSQYLFCGITPVLQLQAVRLVYINKGGEILLEGENLFILQEGVARRKHKQKGEGSQLTVGSILNLDRLASLIQQQVYNPSEDLLTALQTCTLLCLQIEEFLRILKLNPILSELLSPKIKIILEKRNLLYLKSLELKEQHTQRTKEANQTVQMHYPVSFRKNRPKTACTNQPFRKKWDNQNSDQILTQFTTIDRYDKMIQSKERVATAKASCRIYHSEMNFKIPVSSNDGKKAKLQSKLLKLQTGKIQKLSQRDSKADGSGACAIRKNLFQVTHLFDEPIDPSETLTPPVRAKEAKHSMIRRMSGIKPEQYLKEQYLTAFYKKSSNRISEKDLQIASNEEFDKENQIYIPRFAKTDTNLWRKGREKLTIRVNEPK